MPEYKDITAISGDGENDYNSNNNDVIYAKTRKADDYDSKI